jgi:hypothetical protein
MPRLPTRPEFAAAVRIRRENLEKSAVNGYLVGIVVAAGCFSIGGWPFAAISLAVLVVLSRGAFDATTVLLTAGVGMLWLGLFLFTGDRRLFFPFTIQFALQAAFQRRPAFLGCAGIVGVFLMIRMVQGATLEVLLVELAVAAAVVGVSMSAYMRTSGGWISRLGWAGFGSFLAFLGLAL